MKILIASFMLLSNIGFEWLDTHFSAYDKMQKQIHEYAEPCYMEHKSSALLIEHLEANGFTIERGVANIPTAFVATYGSGKPVIGILAEYDALPGLSQDTTACFQPRIKGGYGHACGHNLLGTGSVAAAVAVSKWLKEGHSGTIKLFGCPAEEGGSGKAYMVRDGVFEGVDCALAWHPARRNRILRDTYTAMVSILFDFEGKPSHAGGSPQKGRSALDGVEAMNYMMNLNREHFPQKSRTAYIITDGGESPSIVPAKAQVYYFLRHPDPIELLSLAERTIRAAEGAAMGTGTKVTYKRVAGSYPILHNEHLSQMAQRNLEKVGGVHLTDAEKAYASELKRNAGHTTPVDFSLFEKVLPMAEMTTSGGSDDTGDVSQVVPLCKVETCANIIGAHTWHFSSISGTTIGTKALVNGAKTIYLTIVELFEKPKELKAIRDEFEAVRGKEYKHQPLAGNTPPIDFFINSASGK